MLWQSFNHWETYLQQGNLPNCFLCPAVPIFCHDYTQLHSIATFSPCKFCLCLVMEIPTFQEWSVAMVEVE